MIKTQVMQRTSTPSDALGTVHMLATFDNDPGAWHGCVPSCKCWPAGQPVHCSIMLHVAHAPKVPCCCTLCKICITTALTLVLLSEVMMHFHQYCKIDTSRCPALPCLQLHHPTFVNAQVGRPLLTSERQVQQLYHPPTAAVLRQHCPTILR